MAAASKKGQASAKGSANDPKNSDKIMRDSGSSWGARQVEYYNIKVSEELDLAADPIFHGLNTRKLDRSIAKALGEVNSTYLSRRPFKDLMMPTGGLGVMFGPFLTLMARIKEDAPGSNDPRSQPHRAGKENVQYYEPSSESEGEHSDDDFAPSTNTDRSAHLARAKAEVPTHVMIYLFDVLAFGMGLKIDSPDVVCTSISDGALLQKGFNGARWGEQGGLVYCSVETKARFTNWSEDGSTPEQAIAVMAQEASQLIGMICQRLTSAVMILGTDLDPADLSEYDRTVFLVSGTQRTMYLKVATFSPAYIRYYFADLLKVARSKQKGKQDSKDTTTS